MVIKKNDMLNEGMYIKTLSSGAKCYIIPKSGYGEAQAIAAFNYGSNDIDFLADGKEFNSPDGVAHFLEHKLFEEEWGNVFEEFSKNGANANAFTDFNKTAYYFSCTEKFEENFERLLKFVQSPYFTEESTEREKGIIGQEITMYDDDPSWQVVFNMLRGMYFNHTVSKNIAGSIKSIADVDKDTLYKCYKSFYCPENMTVVCVGDLKPEKVFEEADRIIKKTNCKRAKTIYENEPSTVCKNYVESKMEISKSLFNLGFKINPKDINVKKVYGIKILLDLVAGSGSALYERIYKAGLMDEEPGLQFTAGEGYAFAIIAGNSNDSKKTADEIINEITILKKLGFKEEDFERIKKKHIGRFIRGFNSVDAIAMSQIELGVKGEDLFDAFQAICGMKKTYLEEILRDEFNTDSIVLSVVKQ